MPFGGKKDRASKKEKEVKPKKKKGKKKVVKDRDGDFMSEPKGGWLHDQQALGHGAGVYYSFPVRYIGSIQVLTSLRALNGRQKTEVCREAINRCIETAKIQKIGKRKPQPYVLEILADAPFVKPLDLKLNVSSSGIASSDIGDPKKIISNDPIGKISFAAGGEKKTYSYVTYVAKDKRNNRFCHVFDCAAVADDVLATLGQVFTLINSGGARRDTGLPVVRPPPLPSNHPTFQAPLQGAALLAAAPKIAPPPKPGSGMPGDTDDTKPDDGLADYEGMDAVGSQPSHVYGELEGPADATYEGVPEMPQAVLRSTYVDMDKDGNPPPPLPAGMPRATSAGAVNPLLAQKPKQDETVEMYGEPEKDGSTVEMYNEMEPIAGQDGAPTIGFAKEHTAQSGLVEMYGEPEPQAAFGFGEDYMDVEDPSAAGTIPMPKNTSAAFVAGEDYMDVEDPSAVAAIPMPQNTYNSLNSGEDYMDLEDPNAASSFVVPPVQQSYNSLGAANKMQMQGGIPVANTAYDADKTAGALDLYQQLEGPDVTGERLVNFLNTQVQVQSRNIYGDEEEEDLYGDGTIGWSYLDIKEDEEDTYGTLADFAALK